ncbi:S8 family serine peptidase [Lutibacter sp.]|uniref:S8 family serine peptidase n=1 Tax=Lutibacter sp. TaxID=1925666 RepID=UPI003564E140
MKTTKFLLKIVLFFVLTIPLFFIGCQNDDGQIVTQEMDAPVNFKSVPIEGQYIVILNGESSAKKANLKYSQMKSVLTDEIFSKFSNIQLAKENIIQTYGYSINGFAAKLDENQLQLLKKDSRIKLIEQDQLMMLGKPAWAGGGGSTTTPQEVPWGIARVNGGVNGTNTGTAWIIDTGIDFSHPDLNVDVLRSRSFLGGKDANDPNDANGHGTHVAGTIAAIDNSEGVIGVAAGAKVVAVRVLDRRGSGSYSGVMAGVDYVGANGSSGDVANMSLGGSFSQALNDAVVAASSGGVMFCLAAGNESDDANNHSPASANGTYIVTVSASDSNNNFASFSNFGNPPIDWCAPGVSIKSTWIDGGYNTISGTSMATPHVAGVLLLGSGTKLMEVIGDPDSSPDWIIKH